MKFDAGKQMSATPASERPATESASSGSLERDGSASGRQQLVMDMLDILSNEKITQFGGTITYENVTILKTRMPNADLSDRAGRGGRA